MGMERAQFSTEFVIPGNSIERLRENESRVKRLFNVDVKYSSSFKRGNTTMQWICLQHALADAKAIEDAKTYIISMTNPVTCIVMSIVFPPLLQETVDEVEAQTCAFLTPAETSVVLEGSQLAVVLAQSMLESVQQESAVEGNKTGRKDTDVVHTVEEEEIAYDVTDGRLPAGDHLLARGLPRALPESNSSSKHQQSTARKIPSQNLSSAETDIESRKKYRSPTPSHISPRGPGNSSRVENDEVTSTSVSSDAGVAMQYSSMIDLGLAHHYDLDVIEEGLKRCDMTEVVKPVEFLNILEFIASSKKESEGNERRKENHEEPFVISSDEDESNSPFEMKRNKKREKAAFQHTKPTRDQAGFVGVGKRPCPVASTSSSSSSSSSSSNQLMPGGLQQAKQGPALPPVVRMGRTPRHIVIDGNNVAMHHGSNRVYSVKGIQICAKYFQARGHKVTAFVSGTRRYANQKFPIKDRPLLEQLELEGVLKFTPSRRLTNGRVISSYDDRFVLNLAEMEKGIIVSNDQYRDLLYEKPSYKQLIETSLLPFMFVGDLFMPPDDPLGRHGPKLEEFLMGAEEMTTVDGGGGGLMAPRPNTSAAPGQGVKGVPGSNHHPQRGQGRAWQEQEKPWQLHVDYDGERKKERAGIDPTAMRNLPSRHHGNVAINNAPIQMDYDLQNARGLDLRSGNSCYHQNNNGEGVQVQPRPFQRSERKTTEIYNELSLMFPEPEQLERLRVVLQNHPDETDLTRLCNYVMNA